MRVSFMRATAKVGDSILAGSASAFTASMTPMSLYTVESESPIIGSGIETDGANM